AERAQPRPFAAQIFRRDRRERVALGCKLLFAPTALGRRWVVAALRLAQCPDAQLPGREQRQWRADFRRAVGLRQAAPEERRAERELARQPTETVAHDEAFLRGREHHLRAARGRRRRPLHTARGARAGWRR